MIRCDRCGRTHDGKCAHRWVHLVIDGAPTVLCEECNARRAAHARAEQRTPKYSDLPPPIRWGVRP
jgi:hypothetical protein